MDRQEETEHVTGQVLGAEADKDSPACSLQWGFWNWSSLSSAQTLGHSLVTSKTCPGLSTFRNSQHAFMACSKAYSIFVLVRDERERKHHFDGLQHSSHTTSSILNLLTKEPKHNHLHQPELHLQAPCARLLISKFPFTVSRTLIY